MHQTGRRSGSWSRKGMLAVATTIAAALALSGCASSDNGGASSSGTSAAQSSAAQASSAAPGSSAKPSSAASSQATSGTTASLTIATNGISGGKNALEADWITNYVIPEFTKQQAAKGVTVTATYQPSGVDDEQYKSKLALDLKAGSGPDIMSIDGIWVGEFAQAGYIKPLSEVVGPSYEQWDGWAQIKEPVQGNVSFQDERYGVPAGTDGRVIFFNKKLFEQAGLPADWQPKSWDDIAAAAEQLKSINGITPLQLNGGSAMGEATTMQGVLPLLVGTGATIYSDGKWLGNTPQLRSVLDFYNKVYNTDGLGDPQLQLDAKGRDESFAEFADNKIGMLIESDYFWRSVVEPTKGVAPMADRDTAVGYALIPAQTAGSGVNGNDNVSMSGGSGFVLNPNTANPELAWELLTFMASPEAIKARLGTTAQITARDDVNNEILAGDPMLSFVAKDVLPVTNYRPGLAEYTQVSAALQQATADVVSGTSVEDAAATYQTTVEGIVGAGNVSSG